MVDINSWLLINVGTMKDKVTKDNDVDETFVRPKRIEEITKVVG